MADGVRPTTWVGLGLGLGLGVALGVGVRVGVGLGLTPRPTTVARLCESEARLVRGRSRVRVRVRVRANPNPNPNPRGSPVAAAAAHLVPQAQRGAREQREQQVEHGGVEGGREEAEDAVGGADGVPADEGAGEGERGAVLDQHALG